MSGRNGGGDSTDPRNDREGFLRIPPPIYDQWLRRCHREGGRDVDKAAAIVIQQALRRDGSVIGEDQIPENAEGGQEEDVDQQ